MDIAESPCREDFFVVEPHMQDRLCVFFIHLSTISFGLGLRNGRSHWVAPLLSHVSGGFLVVGKGEPTLREYLEVLLGIGRRCASREPEALFGVLAALFGVFKHAE